MLQTQMVEVMDTYSLDQAQQRLVQLVILQLHSKLIKRKELLITVLLKDIQLIRELELKLIQLIHTNKTDRHLV